VGTCVGNPTSDETQYDNLLDYIVIVRLLVARE